MFISLYVTYSELHLSGNALTNSSNKCFKIVVDDMLRSGDLVRNFINLKHVQTCIFHELICILKCVGTAKEIHALFWTCTP